MKIKTFVVLGMHRSATSLTAGALSHIIDMGSGYRPVSDQPNGNWEDLDFYYMNEKILKEAGGTWYNPPHPSRILSVGEELKQEIKNLVEYKNDRGILWGWKDPRTVLTIDLYLPYLINPHYICNFREPLQVAESLFKRNNMSIREGIFLAKEYNKRILNFLTSQGLT